MLEVYFWIFASIAGLCALGVLVTRHPIAGALNLVGVMLSLAGIYGLLDNSFLGTVQILVYAGAIMMLIVFVIMVLNAAHDRAVPHSGPLRLSLGIVLSGVLLLIIGGVVGQLDLSAADEIAVSVKATGQSLFDTGEASRGYFLLFELTGLLLLAGMVAAIQLAKLHLGEPEEFAA